MFDFFQQFELPINEEQSAMKTLKIDTLWKAHRTQFRAKISQRMRPEIVNNRPDPKKCCSV